MLGHNINNNDAHVIVCQNMYFLVSYHVCQCHSVTWIFSSRLYWSETPSQHSVNMKNYPPTFDASFHDERSVSKLTYRSIGATNMLASSLSFGASSLGGVFRDTNDDESGEVDAADADNNDDDDDCSEAGAEPGEGWNQLHWLGSMVWSGKIWNCPGKGFQVCRERFLFNTYWGELD